MVSAILQTPSVTSSVTSSVVALANVQMYIAVPTSVITWRSHWKMPLKARRPRYASPSWRSAKHVMDPERDQEPVRSHVRPAVGTVKYVCNRAFSRCYRHFLIATAHDRWSGRPAPPVSGEDG